MQPMYAHCPHCGFPAVIPGFEVSAMRYCRQCRGCFCPEECRGGVPEEQEGITKKHRRKLALRSLLRSVTRTV